jgi:plastocyanin
LNFFLANIIVARWSFHEEDKEVMMNVHKIQRAIRRGVLSILTLWSVAVYFPANAEAAAVRGTVRIGSDLGEGAVVYLKETGPKPAPVKPIEVTIRQENLEFRPFFTVVPVGSTILFENQDSEMHNVQSTTPGNRFDIGAHNKGEIKSVIFQKPGAVMLRCKIHTQMRGMVFVAPSQYYAVAGKDGKYDLRNVPAGAYQIEAWHPRLTGDEVKAGSRSISVGAEALSVDFVLTGQAPKEANLTEVPDKDWMEVHNQIRASLDQAIAKWKEGKKTGALTKVMTTHSGLYGESGLRNAISQKLGKSQAEMHDAQFNTLVKQFQKDGPSAETAIRSEQEKLLSNLKKDIQKMK